jgi:hypothetical protein
MASAIQLTATATVLGQQGLAINANVTSQLATYQSHAPITLVATAFATAKSGNANVTLLPILGTIGSNVAGNQWLIDFYPGNIAPTTSSTVFYYGNSTYPNTASASHNISTQSNLPFSHGVQGFANVYSTVSTYASTVFDTVASVHQLQGKTYAQSGIGFTGPQDLATNGISSAAPIIANVVGGWGTMYDINNINTAGNVYIFGQNLLNQKLGQYGNLTGQLSAAGLDTTNLVKIPPTTTTTTHTVTTVTSHTKLGTVTKPVVTEVTTTNAVTGSSPDVVMSIYQSVTGANLQSIVTATGVTVANASITTLADYLNFNKVVDAVTLAQLAAINVTDFDTFGSYVHSRVGQGKFKSWTDLVSTLTSMATPALSSTTASADTPVLSSTATTALNNMTGTGTGPMNNPIPVDYLGACSGDPYASALTTINTNYGSLLPANLTTYLTSLNTAVAKYSTAYDLYLTDPGNITLPSTGYVISNVNLINSSLNSLPVNAASIASKSAYYTMLNRLGTEVGNLQKAGVVFDAGTAQGLTTFAQGIGTAASDQKQYYTYQFFANLITADAAGDTIHAAVAEIVNTSVLASKGIQVSNDPNPSQAISQAAAQNIPLSTYLSQNK